VSTRERYEYAKRRYQNRQVAENYESWRSAGASPSRTGAVKTKVTDHKRRETDIRSGR
jgi:hypothetical protein